MNSRRGIFDSQLTDEQHREGVRDWYRKIRKASQAMGARFSVIPSSWFWRHRIRAIQLITNMQVAMSAELGRRRAHPLMSNGGRAQPTARL